MEMKKLRGYVVVVLKRFVSHTQKNNAHIVVPDELKISAGGATVSTSLHGTVVHTGVKLEGRSNNYFAFLRHPSGWWKVDGQAVDRCEAGMVKASQTYIALYKA